MLSNVFLAPGESVAVQKCSHALQDVDIELQGKENMLFSGTAIANGTVVGIVTATGMRTEIGKIQLQIKVSRTGGLLQGPGFRVRV